MNTNAPEAMRVETPQGEGRLHLHLVPGGAAPEAVLLLSHGAGNGVETADLQALALALPAQNVVVALFEQPWRVAGRKLATPPATLDVAFVAAAAALRERFADVPLVVGGRSAGARSACRTADQVGAVAALPLAFPLHPPGRPEKSRLDELRLPSAAGLPTLVLQGERDTFGRPEEFPDDVDLAVVPDGDHSFRVTKRSGVSADEALAVIVEATLEWLTREAAGA
ncbi:alpha/beta family hydrolase [Nocardioides yefusunii]|uniref:Alpha/beta family hydrolase n=1 Tax=Nocardioides yefusunii TaxID=2500546 RepID=A0ABW1QZP2_9ACTN|nr:alpha/beta family hydrolase [Nocardioides yefusunii]